MGLPGEEQPGRGGASWRGPHAALGLPRTAPRLVSIAGPWPWGVPAPEGSVGQPQAPRPSAWLPRPDPHRGSLAVCEGPQPGLCLAHPSSSSPLASRPTTRLAMPGTGCTSSLSSSSAPSSCSTWCWACSPGKRLRGLRAAPCALGPGGWAAELDTAGLGTRRARLAPRLAPHGGHARPPELQPAFPLCRRSDLCLDLCVWARGRCCTGRRGGAALSQQQRPALPPQPGHLACPSSPVASLC